jgi:hypothetical protein
MLIRAQAWRGVAVLAAWMVSCGSSGSSPDDGGAGRTGAGGTGAGGTNAGGTNAGGTGGKGAGGTGTGGGADPCPTGMFANCAKDCGGMTLSCGVSSFNGCTQASGGYPTIRTSTAADACKVCGNTMATVHVLVPAEPAAYYRVSVSPPWSIVDELTPACTVGTTCKIIYSWRTATVLHNGFTIVTTDLAAPARNVVVEPVDETAACM